MIRKSCLRRSQIGLEASIVQSHKLLKLGEALSVHLDSAETLFPPLIRIAKEGQRREGNFGKLCVTPIAVFLT